MQKSVSNGIQKRHQLISLVKDKMLIILSNIVELTHFLTNFITFAKVTNKLTPTFIFPAHAKVCYVCEGVKLGNNVVSDSKYDPKCLKHSVDFTKVSKHYINRVMLFQLNFS